METPSLSPADRAAFVQATSALLATRERLEFLKEHPGPTGPGIAAAGQQALKIIARICREGTGISALRFRGQIFFPTMRPNGTIDTLHIVPEAEIVDVEG